MKLFARIRAGKKSPNKKRGRRGWRWIAVFFLLAIPVAIVIAILSFYAVWAQTFDLKRLGTMPERNTVFDVDGKIYSRLAGANRLKVSLDQVSPLFIQALLAREGALGLVLREVIDYERGAWTATAYRGLSSARIRGVYFEAIRWAHMTYAMTSI